MNHSARPRIEAPATFVLTVDEPAPAPGECLSYAAGDAPAYSLVGTGSDGTIVLDADALASTESESHCLVVLMQADVYTSACNGVPPSLSSISDDSPATVPDYLKLDGEACYSGDWNIINLDSSPVFKVPTRGAHVSDSYIMGGAAAIRFLDRDLAAGTTITYDFGINVSEAKAFLVERLSPYAPVSNHGSDSAGVISTLFYPSGLVIAWIHGDKSEDHSCGIFTGEDNTGFLTTIAQPSDEALFGAAAIDMKEWNPKGGSVGCTASDTVIDIDQHWFMGTFSSGSSYDLGVLPSDSVGAAWGSGIAFPGQGF